MTQEARELVREMQEEARALSGEGVGDELARLFTKAATTITTLLDLLAAAERARDETAKELEALTVGSNALLASQNEIVHKITARADAAERKLAEVERERDEAKLCQQQVAAGTGQSATVARIIIAKGDAEASADKLAAALEGHERTLAFIAKWAWRDGNLTDAERLSSIKYHPAIKAIADPARSALADKGVANG